MDHLPLQFQQLLLDFTPVIGASPTAQSFATLVLGWILCKTRRTLSAVIRAAGPEASKSHDAYQNFFSKSQWSMDPLWRVLCLVMVNVLVSGRGESNEPIWIAGDDTLCKHYGRKIWGAGLYRDAGRSSKKHTAYAWGLNWVVLAMVIKVPLLKDRFMALPIYARLSPKTTEESQSPVKRRGKKTKAKGKGRKKKKGTVLIMETMIHTVAAWLPKAHFRFCGDGAYACLAGSLPNNVHLVSRIRCDAALFQLPPPKREHQPGRPPQKGRRIPSPQEMAKQVGKRWRRCTIDLYGERVERHLYSFTALWYEVSPNHLVKLIIVRDPEGEKKDDYFFTTDLTMTPQEIVLSYTGRWAIEVVFRETKQYLGMNEPQARKKKAVLRTTPFCLWLNSIIKLWFLLESQETEPTLLENDPWYPHKATISFQDMLGALRLHFWRNYIFEESTSEDNFTKIRDFIVKSLATVT